MDLPHVCLHTVWWLLSSMAAQVAGCDAPAPAAQQTVSASAPTAPAPPPAPVEPNFLFASLQEWRDYARSLPAERAGRCASSRP